VILADFHWILDFHRAMKTTEKLKLGDVASSLRLEIGAERRLYMN
jgi:hypothetical protein